MLKSQKISENCWNAADMALNRTKFVAVASKLVSTWCRNIADMLIMVFSLASIFTFHHNFRTSTYLLNVILVQALYCEPNDWNVLANVSLSSSSSILNECKLCAMSFTVGTAFERGLVAASTAYDWRASCLETASTVNEANPFIFDGTVATIEIKIEHGWM